MQILSTARILRLVNVVYMTHLITRYADVTSERTLNIIHWQVLTTHFAMANDGFLAGVLLITAVSLEVPVKAANTGNG